MLNVFNNFYKGRKVFITGHTGFKGSWLCILLHELGAEVYGYALAPPTNPSFYELAKVDQLINSTIGDVRNYDYLYETLKKVQPEIIIHMAAQPLVRESYINPRETYEINVMGTVNLLEAVRHIASVKAVLNITTDKCYENKEWHWAYRENEPMGGYDPYSNSKGCSELVTSSFRNSFFNPGDYPIHGVALASARAGNVIGGGDWAQDRLIPDIIKAIERDEKVKIRNPKAIRPWQHVLEPLTGYLQLCEKLITDGSNYAQAWNFGSDNKDAKNVEWITRKFCQLNNVDVQFEIDNSAHSHEANFLKLDCSKANAELNWYSRLSIDKTLQMIVDWNKAYQNKIDIRLFSITQIEKYYLELK